MRRFHVDTIRLSTLIAERRTVWVNQPQHIVGRNVSPITEDEATNQQP